MILIVAIVLGLILGGWIISSRSTLDAGGKTNVPVGAVVFGVCVFLVCVFLGNMLKSSIGIIQPGAVGVVVHLGRVDKTTVLPEGPFFVTPFVSKVIDMDVQTRAFQANAEASSHDLQTVNTQVTVNYNLDPKQAPMIYDTMRQEYSDRIIAPAIQETVKASTAPFTAEELITKRAIVRDNIDRTLTNKLKPFGITVVAISISDFKFSDTFNEAVEKKVQAQQAALTEKANTDSVTQQAIQTKTQADADAYKQRAMKQSLTADMIQYEAIQKWDGHLPNVSGGNIPFINLKQ